MTQLNIAGKEVRLHFGIYLAEKLTQEAGSIDVNSASGYVDFITALIYHAHANYCKAWQEPQQVQRGEVYTFVEDGVNDDVITQQLADVVAAYNDSKIAKRITKVVADSEEKKTNLTTESLGATASELWDLSPGNTIATP